MSKAQRRSKLQKKILSYVADKPAKKLQEIAEAVDASPSSIGRSVSLLKKQGLVYKSSSGYHLTAEGRNEVARYFSNLPQFKLPAQFSPYVEEMRRQQTKFISEVYRKISKEQFEMVVEKIESLQKIAQGVSESIRRQMVDVYERVLQPMQTVHKQITELINSEVLQVVQKTQQFFISLQERDKTQSIAIRRINEKLIPYEWVFSPSLPLPLVTKIYQLLEKKGIEHVRGSLTDYFSDETCKEIIQKICSEPAFSKRVHLIKDAFQAHCEGRYSLSIPIFLSQAEGAFSEHFQKPLYERKEKKYLKKIVGSFFFQETEKAFVEGFDKLLQDVLAKSYGLKDKISEGVFGRHPILHGNSVDYGTRENSIKAILVLDYVSFIIHLK